MTPDALLEQFHSQIRLRDRDAAPGFVVDRDGPVHRTYPPDAAEHGAMVECPEGLGDDPEHWVARQVEFFTARGQVVEWKTYGYDEPADLPERLVRAGFVADDPEVVLLGRCADLVHDVDLPAGTRMREIAADEDWERVRVSVDKVWGEDTSWINDALRAEQRRDPDLLTAVVVEDAATLEVLSYGVLRAAAGDRLLRAVGWLDPGGVAGPRAVPRADVVPRPAGPRARLPLRPRGHLPRLAPHPHRARDARRGRHPAVPARPLPGCRRRGFGHP